MDNGTLLVMLMGTCLSEYPSGLKILVLASFKKHKTAGTIFSFLF